MPDISWRQLTRFSGNSYESQGHFCTKRPIYINCVRICVYVCVYVCICVYMCVYVYMYIIHATLCFVREIKTEYEPNTNHGEAEVYLMICISRTKQRVACIIYLCRSCVETSPHSTHPCLTRPQIPYFLY